MKIKSEGAIIVALISIFFGSCSQEPDSELGWDARRLNLQSETSMEPQGEMLDGFVLRPETVVLSGGDSRRKMKAGIQHC